MRRNVVEYSKLTLPPLFHSDLEESFSISDKAYNAVLVVHMPVVLDCGTDTFDLFGTCVDRKLFRSTEAAANTYKVIICYHEATSSTNQIAENTTSQTPA